VSECFNIPTQQTIHAIRSSPGNIVLDVTLVQWRRQDLLRGGAAKVEIMSWGTHGELHGRVPQLIND